MSPIRMGIVGACGRGASFRTACEALGDIAIEAVCDLNADMTLPGLVSQQSILQGGGWLEVPDSRAWRSG
jgi:hypothetical protein